MGNKNNIPQNKDNISNNQNKDFGLFDLTACVMNPEEEKDEKKNKGITLQVELQNTEVNLVVDEDKELTEFVA